MSQIAIPRERATQYPTRYDAHDRPGIIFEHPQPKESGGFEWAAFSDPMTNVHYPHLEDGVYASIYSFQDKRLAVEVHACRPDRGRAQKVFYQPFPYVSYSAALAWMVDRIAEARAFCQVAP